MMWNCVKGVEFDIMCGVPYTALPIATCMSLGFNLPMVGKSVPEAEHTVSKLPAADLVGDASLFLPARS